MYIYLFLGIFLLLQLFQKTSKSKRYDQYDNNTIIPPLIITISHDIGMDFSIFKRFPSINLELKFKYVFQDIFLLENLKELI